MSKVGVYVDGFNLYHAINMLGEPRLKWLNLVAVANRQLGKDDVLQRVCYFTAEQTHSPDKLRRHRQYMDALRAVGVEVFPSRFHTVDKWCDGHARYCEFREEKRTDVQLAVTCLMDAVNKSVDRFILITADSDQVPTVEAVGRHSGVSVEIATPPGRYLLATELRKATGAPSTELRPELLRECLFDQDVYKTNGKKAATRPAEYAP